MNNAPKGKQKEIWGMHWIFQGIGLGNNKRTSKINSKKGVLYTMALPLI